MLSDEEVEMVVMLRMDETFITFMRHHYPQASQEQFGRCVTVVTAETNVEEDF